MFDFNVHVFVFVSNVHAAQPLLLIHELQHWSTVEHEYVDRVVPQ